MKYVTVNYKQEACMSIEVDDNPRLESSNLCPFDLINMQICLEGGFILSVPY